MPPVPWDAGDVSAADAFLAAAIRPPSGHRAGTLERVSPHRSISAATARRFLVRRHLLAPPRSLPPEPASVMRVVDRLGSLQFDPLEVAGPQPRPDAARPGRRLPADRGRTSCCTGTASCTRRSTRCSRLVPTAELPWYRITWDRMHAEHTGGPFDEHAPLVEELLARIRDERAAVVHGRGAARGHRLVLAAHEPGPGDPRGARRGRHPGDRAARGQPARLRPRRAAVPRRAARAAPPGARAAAAQAAVAVPGNGLLGASGDYSIWAGTGDAAHADVAARRAGGDGSDRPGGRRGAQGPAVRGRGRGADAGRRRGGGRPPGARIGRRRRGRGAFLAPLDPLAWDRDLLLRLWGFDYRWEVYVPAAKRRWGYYVLPLLYGDRFVGRIEPRIDRRTGTLRILGPVVGGGLRPAVRRQTRASSTPSPTRSGRTWRSRTSRKLAMPRVARHRELAAAVTGEPLRPRGRGAEARRRLAAGAAPERSRRRAARAVGHLAGPASAPLVRPADHPRGHRLVRGLVHEDERARSGGSAGTGPRTAAG